MYRSIIVPLDGSARSHAALPIAARLAKVAGATLDLVRVHLNERADLADDPSWDAMFAEGERRYLESLALAYESVIGGSVGTALLDAPVASAIAEFANARVAPLIVMTARGRTGLRRAFLGSTSDGLVRAADVPVLILRDHSPDDEAPAWRFNPRPFARIVVPLDGTAYAECAIAHAVTIARSMDATLHLVRVVGPVMTSTMLGAVAMHPIMPYDEATALRNDLAQEYLRGVVDRIAADGGLRVTTEVTLSTDPATAIIESCRRHAADLIVMATHGRGASRLIVSAVGDRVLHDGPDAILFVKPPAAAKSRDRRNRKKNGRLAVPPVVR
jgi:nucleotide-binding universal stress UspA family protein